MVLYFFLTRLNFFLNFQYVNIFCIRYLVLILVHFRNKVIQSSQIVYFSNSFQFFFFFTISHLGQALNQPYGEWK